MKQQRGPNGKMVNISFSKPSQAKAYRGSRGTHPLILRIGTRWVWVVSFTSRPFYPLERDPVSTVQDAGWAPDTPSGSFWKTSLTLLTMIRTQDSPYDQMIAVWVRPNYRFVWNLHSHKWANFSSVAPVSTRQQSDHEPLQPFQAVLVGRAVLVGLVVHRILLINRVYVEN